MDSMNPSPEGDASGSRRGLVNLIAQALAGAKTFLDLLTAASGIYSGGPVEIDGTLEVNSVSFFNDNVAVFGNVSLDGTVDVIGVLGVSGVAYLNGGVNVESGISVNTGNVSLSDGAVYVTGAGSTISLEQGQITADAMSVIYAFMEMFIFGADGTAGAPAMYRNGDTTTGLFWPALGNVAFSASGIERLRIGNRVTITGAAVGTTAALTSAAASLAINLMSANNFTHTLTENTTLAAPSNPIAGQSGVIVFTQHASSPKTLAFNSFWKFAGGTIPTLTATNGAVDVLSYYVESTGRATCALIKDVK